MDAVGQQFFKKLFYFFLLYVCRSLPRWHTVFLCICDDFLITIKIIENKKE